MKKYDLIEYYQAENPLEVIRKIGRKVFKSNPKEVYVVVVAGSKVEKEPTSSGELTIKVRHSFIKVHVYDNMIDAMRKVNRYCIHSVVLYSVSKTKYVTVLTRNMPSQSNSETINYPIYNLDDESLQRLVVLTTTRHYASIKIHF